MARDYMRILFDTDEHDIERVLKNKGITLKFLDKSVRLIQDWYRLQPHFPKAEPTIEHLRRTLIVNKCSVEKAKGKIENLLMARTFMPEFFSNRDIMSSTLQEYLKVVQLLVLPKWTPDNARVLIFRIIDDMSDLYDPLLNTTLAILMGDFRLELEAYHNEYQVWDMSNIKMAHVLKLTLTQVKKAFFILENCYGASIKGIHMIKCPPFAEMVIKVMQSYLKSKLTERIHMHSSIDTVFDFIPRDVFPKDMGGTHELTSTQITDNWVEAMSSPQYRDLLINMKDIKTDESKRQGKPCHIYSERSEMHGSFRKLNID